MNFLSNADENECNSECNIISELVKYLPRIEGRPDRDGYIGKEDICNLRIELGLYEEGKISFEQFLGRI